MQTDLLPEKRIGWDTYISSSSPGQNYGLAEQMWISSGRISLIRSKMPTLPAKAHIDSAKMYVYYYYYDKVTGGSLTAGAYPINQSWGEYTLTWNIAKPDTTSCISSTRVATASFSGSAGAYQSSPKTTSFDLTATVRAWRENPSSNYGIALKYEEGTNSSVILNTCETTGDVRAYYIISYSTGVDNGSYFLENPKHEQYMQINDNDAPDYNNNGGIAEIHPFDGGDYQRWVFTHVEYGYYKITSKKNGYAVTVPLGKEAEEDVDLTLRPYIAGNSNQLWCITTTSQGYYKIKAKSAESTTNKDLVLAVETNLSPTYDRGWNIQQRTYENNTSYRDEWTLYNVSACPKINVDVIYDQAYSNRYSNAVTRINKQMQSLQRVYLERFGIWVEYTDPTIFTSFTDSCCSTSPTKTCTHVGESSCKNSLLHTDGTASLQTYHHNNIFNLVLRIPFPDISQSVKIVFTGHKTCAVVDLVHREHPFYGITFPDIGLMAIMNFDGATTETKTTVHEFGHLFGAPDHYDADGQNSTGYLNSLYSDRKFSDSCIYGAYKDSDNVMNNLIICEGCRKTIAENIPE